MSSIPLSGRSPGKENGNPLQYSCLGKLHRGAWQPIVYGATKRFAHDLVSKQQQCISKGNHWLSYCNYSMNRLIAETLPREMCVDIIISFLSWNLLLDITTQPWNEQCLLSREKGQTCSYHHSGSNNTFMLSGNFFFVNSYKGIQQCIITSPSCHSHC